MTKTNYMPSALMCGLLCLGLMSCSKSDGDKQASITYPLEVKATALEEQGPVKLYTKDGEVTDETVIAKFISNPPSAINLSFNETFEPSERNIITFTTDSTAQFGISEALHKVKKNSEDEIRFSTDFLLEYNNTASYEELLDAYNISKNNEPLTALPAQSGISYKGTSLTLAQGEYSSFKLPILLYYLKRTSTGLEGETESVSASFNKLFNEFNPDFVSHLGARDTIAVQQTWVRYEG